MAVRTSASTQNYSTTLSLGTQTKFSITCWMKISVDRNANSAAWVLWDSGLAHYKGILTDLNGVQPLFLDDNVAIITGPTLTVGTWYFLGVSYDADADSSIMTSRAIDASSFTTSTSASALAGHSVANLHIANSQAGSSGGSFLNGCITAFKGWSGRAMTTAQLQNEAWSHLPRHPNPTFWYPLITTETPDYSGNGYTLTGGSGATVEDGPGIGWGMARAGIYIPAVTVVVHALTATGLSTASDSATLRLRMPLAATGLSAASGTAAIHVVSGLTATGLSASASTATLRVTRAMAGIGLSAAASQATLTLTHALTASGLSSSAGSAGLTVTIVAVGLSTSLDSAALALLMPLAGVGLEVSYDSADMTLEFPLDAIGLSSSTDSATLYIALPYSPGPTRAGGVVGEARVTGPRGLSRARGQTGRTFGREPT